MSMNKTCPISTFTSEEKLADMRYLLGSNMLSSGEQLLKTWIILDRAPHWIDFQARDGNGLARREREKFFQILHRFRRSTGLRLNLGQGCQVSGTKHRVFLGWQKIECMSGDVDGIRLATQREINPT